jgi:hypothetical protein
MQVAKDVDQIELQCNFCEPEHGSADNFIEVTHHNKLGQWCLKGLDVLLEINEERLFWRELSIGKVKTLELLLKGSIRSRRFRSHILVD